MSELLTTPFLGQEIWRYLIFAALVLGALILGSVIDYLFKHVLTRIVGKTKTKFDNLLLDAVRLPAKLVVYTIAVKYSSGVFSFNDDNFDKAFHSFFDHAAWILIGIIVTVLLLRMVDLAVQYFKQKVEATDSRLDDQLLPILGKLTKILVLTMMTLLVLDNLGYNITSVIAGLGIGGLAVALAAQETLSNFLGSISIFADKPFAIGDRVQVDGVDGPVESVGLRSTRIRTLDGILVTVPNSKMAHATISNVTARPTIKKLFKVNLTYDTGHKKTQRALEILRETYTAEENFENNWVYFTDFGSHSLDILCIYWCKELRYEEYLKITERLNLEILRRFDEEGIEFAFPTQTIYHKKGDENLPAEVSG